MLLFFINVFFIIIFFQDKVNFFYRKQINNQQKFSTNHFEENSCLWYSIVITRITKKGKGMKRIKILWYRCVLKIVKFFKRKSSFKYLGEKLENPCVILTNHVGASAPLSFELFLDHPFRFWGTHEMTEGLRANYKYLSEIYFKQKKGKSKTLSKIIAFFACPFTNLFYKGLNLIPTYTDLRLKKTISESFKTIKENQSLIIFPEMSDDGYHDKLKGFYAGAVFFLEYCLKKGFDLPVYLSYFHKKERVHVVDKPVMFSQLLSKYKSRKELSIVLCDRCNELGQKSYLSNS